MRMVICLKKILYDEDIPISSCSNIYPADLCDGVKMCIFFVASTKKRVYSKLKGMYTQFKYVWLKVNLAFYL